VNELVAVLVAIAGAATHKVAKRPPLDVKLFADLFANRLWVIGITVDIAGSVMQAFALHFGPSAGVVALAYRSPHLEAGAARSSLKSQAPT
jgi:hypothetical protein